MGHAVGDNTNKTDAYHLASAVGRAINPLTPNDTFMCHKREMSLTPNDTFMCHSRMCAIFSCYESSLEMLFAEYL